MKKVEMIVSDLDGTLLNEMNKVGDKTIKYLKELKKEDYIIVIATGRILKSAIEATNGAEFANYIITDNGHNIYDTTQKKYIYKNLIQNEIVEKICSYYNEEIESITLGTDNGYFWYSNNHERYQENLIKINMIKDFLENSSSITHLSIAVKQNDYVRPLIKRLKEKLPFLFFKLMKDSFKDDEWIEVYQSEDTKYEAIKKVAELENIENKKIIAFGDGLNDVEMIKNCGIGVAMGNSLEEVKNVADYITLSHNEEAVKYFLEKYLN